MIRDDEYATVVLLRTEHRESGSGEFDADRVGQLVIRHDPRQ
jgi:hypothetical protein